MTKQTKKARVSKARSKAPARRRKEGAIGEHKKRLAFPDDLRDNSYNYRWVTDSGSRIHNLVGDDWNIVCKEDGKSAVGTDKGNAVSVYSGTDEDKNPQRQFLMRKHKDHYESDKAAEQAVLDEQMNQLKRGPGDDDSGLGGSNHRSRAYIPSEGISIK